MLSHCAGAQSVQPEFKFATGATVRYDLDLHHEVSDYNPESDASRTGTVERDGVLDRQIRSAASTGNTVAVRLEGQPDWLGGLRDTVLATTATYTQGSRGLLPIRDEITVEGLPETSEHKEAVQSVWEEEVAYLSFPFPSHPVSVGDSWKITVPVKVIGGMFTGNLMYLNAQATVLEIGNVGGENCLRAKIDFSPELELPIDNTTDVKLVADFKVSNASGELLFSLDQGNIVRYSGALHAELKISMNGELKDVNKADFSFKLSRLDH
jgi:hypothetical protein